MSAPTHRNKGLRFHSFCARRVSGRRGLVVCRVSRARAPSLAPAPCLRDTRHTQPLALSVSLQARDLKPSALQCVVTTARTTTHRNKGLRFHSFCSRRVSGRRGLVVCRVSLSLAPSLAPAPCSRDTRHTQPLALFVSLQARDPKPSALQCVVTTARATSA